MTTEITRYFCYNQNKQKTCVLAGSLFWKYVELKNGLRINLACSDTEKNDLLSFKEMKVEIQNSKVLNLFVDIFATSLTFEFWT